LLLLGAFVRQQLAAPEPLVPMRMFANRGFSVDNSVLFLMSICFVPLFFFSSVYAQAALGDTASNAGLFLLVFFAGFVLGAQWGGRVLDRRGARPTVVAGCAVAAVGFYLWGSELEGLSLSTQWYYLAMAGLGIGMVLGPVSTDALNRSSAAAYGAVTGVTQTVRNFGGSLGLAVLGSILITENVSRASRTLAASGVPAEQANSIAHAISGAGGAVRTGAGALPGHLLHAIRLDYASSTRTIVYVMAGAMAAAFLVAVRFMPRGRVVEPVEIAAEASPDGVARGRFAGGPSNQPAAG
jgi:predicted MFS family arabinose efflux permease